VTVEGVLSARHFLYCGGRAELVAQSVERTGGRTNRGGAGGLVLVDGGMGSVIRVVTGGDTKFRA
jgi:hypothetical protein